MLSRGDLVRAFHEGNAFDCEVTDAGFRFVKVVSLDGLHKFRCLMADCVLLESSTRSQLAIPFPARRGGARPGAGRPEGSGRWKEKTVPVRVPESKKAVVAKALELFENLPFLLADWEINYEPGSVESEVALKCAEELRSLLLEVVN